MKVKQILNIDKFNPLEVDISFLEQVSDKIPQEGYMDPAMAEQLATTTLKAADFCIDLLAQATLFLSHCDSKKRASKAKVIKEKLANKVPSTVVQHVYADDEDFIKVSNKYNIALAWHNWLDNKHGALLKAHHLCKDFIKKSEGLQNASGWEPVQNNKSDWEV